MFSHLGEYKLYKLLQVANQTPKGIVIECGVYKGGTLYELAKHFPDRECFGFDTFEGMPKESYNETEVHKPGEFTSSFEEVKNNLKDLKNITLIKGVFPDSFITLDDVSFIHLDMDHGRSTAIAATLFWPLMVKGGVMFFDDYNWHACPNIKPIVDSFAEKKGVKVFTPSENQAYIIKGDG